MIPENIYFLCLDLSICCAVMLSSTLHRWVHPIVFFASYTVCRLHNYKVVKAASQEMVASTT